MKRRNFEKEWQKRLDENRRLTEKPFLPKKAFGVAAWVMSYLFYVILVISFGATLGMFLVFGGKLLQVSRAILFL